MRLLPFAMLLGVAVIRTCPDVQAAAAETYPVKPVRFIIAQGTGSSVDNMARLLGARMSEEWGRQVVADNRGGAGGMIGAEIAARAAPDGYTLLVCSTGMQVVSPQLYKKLAYHPTQDFDQISLFASTQNVLVTNPQLPVNSVKELIAYAKANPGKLNMSNAGSGFQSHLASVMFAHMAAIDVHHVPYKGGTSLISVVAGESQLSIAPAPALIGHVRSGRLKALGTGGEKRSPMLPDLPTIAEAGVPGYLSTGWAGLMAPKGLPKPVFNKVYTSLHKVLAEPATREAFERQGAETMSSTPAEMLKFINEEQARFSQAIKLAGLTVQ